jgi:hypothetical protein
LVQLYGVAVGAAWRAIVSRHHLGWGHVGGHCWASPYLPSHGHSFPRHAILDDVWRCEATFLAARHRLAQALLAVYRHAADWGASELPLPLVGSRAGASASSQGQAGAGPHRLGHCNVPAAQLLGARQRLRREIIDLLHRWVGEGGWMGGSE